MDVLRGLQVARIRVHSAAWTAAKPITSRGLASGSLADAATHAASRLKVGRRRAREVAGKNEAVDMPHA